MQEPDANKATSRSEAVAPLTEAEQFYVNQHPHTPVAELARALGRDEASLAGLVPERAPAFERLLQPIQRQGRTVGTVWNPAASAQMDDHRKTNTERPASSDVPANKAGCNHTPMGHRRNAPAIKLGRPVSDIGKDAPKPAQLDQAPVEITQPAPEQAAGPQRKSGAYTMGGKPQSYGN
jgi:hypothetical protein